MRLPLVPVTVNGYVPGAVDGSTWMVNVEFTEPSAGGVIDVGLRVAVTPDGSPLTLNSMGELKPCIDVAVIVEEPEFPC